MSYLPVIVRDLLPLLLDGLGASAPKVSVNNCWLENERGDAVQWHLPLGALYDALVPLSSQSLVLKLCIRFSSCPPEVMRLLDIDDAMKPQCACAAMPAPASYATSPHLTVCYNRYILDVKQAVVSRDGNDGLKAFATLGEKKENALWNAIVKNDCDAFWGVASSLVSPGMKSVMFTPLLSC